MFSGVPRESLGLAIKLSTIFCFVIILATVGLYQLKLSSATSDAYRLGWIDGRIECYTESAAIYRFTLCVKNEAKPPQQCWDSQISEAQKTLSGWDNLARTQKLQISNEKEQHTWIDALRRGDRNTLPMPRESPGAAQP